MAALDILAANLRLKPADLGDLSKLSEPQLKQLNDALDQAKARQRAALAAGIDGALSHIPFLLRGVVTRLVKP